MRKKEHVQKLKLSRETLKNLEPDSLQNLHGGICATSGAAHSCPTNLSNCCPTNTCTDIC
jgi:hypothetical protein